MREPTDGIVVALTGASGVIYGVRLLEALQNLGVQTTLVVSRTAERILELETNFDLDQIRKLATVSYEEDDLFAPIASGSYVFNLKGMGIVPCSMKTLAAIAHGYSDNLVSRAAEVTLKEKRRLVLVPRETPLTPIHLRNMLLLADLGATIFPPMPSFYDQPNTLEDVIQQTVGRILDHLGVVSDIPKRWKGLENGQTKAVARHGK